jgi:hypothetical protein
MDIAVGLAGTSEMTEGLVLENAGKGSGCGHSPCDLVAADVRVQSLLELPWRKSEYVGLAIFGEVRGIENYGRPPIIEIGISRIAPVVAEAFECLGIQSISKNVSPVVSGEPEFAKVVWPEPTPKPWGYEICSVVLMTLARSQTMRFGWSAVFASSGARLRPYIA